MLFRSMPAPPPAPRGQASPVCTVRRIRRIFLFFHPFYHPSFSSSLSCSNCPGIYDTCVIFMQLWETKKAFILILLLGQKLKPSAVPPNLAHKNAPSLHTYYHTLSLDNGRKSRWALLKPSARCSHLLKSIPYLFDCRNHTACGSLKISQSMYSS